MKKLKNLLAFGAVAVAAVLFAGCSAEEGGGTGTGTDSTSNSTDSGSKPAGSDTSATTVTTGDFHQVSLSVPNMV